MLKNRGRGSIASQPAAPTPFTVRCLCGESIDGYRKADYQILTCPSCGSAVYILGESPLISPDPPRVVVTPPQEKSTTRTLVRRRSLRGRWRLAQQRITRSRRQWGLRLKRWFAVRNLILVGVVGLVVFTVIRQIQLRSDRLGREEIQRLSKEGMLALEKGEMAEADQLLHRALQLMNRTKPFDPEWKPFEHAAIEAEAAARLLGEPLDTTLTFIAEDLKGRQNFIASKGIVFDTLVTPRDDGGFTADAVAFVKDEPVSILFAKPTRADASAFNTPTRVFILARMSSLTHDAEGWHLNFVPGSAALITQPAILDYLGLGNDPELRELVKRQREMILSPEGNQ